MAGDLSKPLGPGLLELEFCLDDDRLAATADFHRGLLRLGIIADTANRLSGFVYGRLVGLKRLAPERCVGVFGLGGLRVDYLPWDGRILS